MEKTVSLVKQTGCRYACALAIVLVSALTCWGQGDRFLPQSQMHTAHRAHYGLKGKVSSMVETSISRGITTQTFKQHVFFNIDGWALHATSDENGFYQTSETWTYDEKHRLLCFTQRDDEGIDSVVCFYDGTGYRIRQQEYWQDEEYLRLITNDKAGRPIRILYDRDSVWFTYNKAGQLREMVINNEFVHKHRYRYYWNSNGLLERIRTGDDKEYEDHHYRYNEQGYVIEEWFTDWQTPYGEKNHEIGTHCYYQYDAYDEYGNWTRRSKAEHNLNTREIHTTATTREITYWE